MLYLNLSFSLCRLALRKDVLLLTEKEMHAAMDLGQPPMVMSNAIDENWGFLSSCE